MSFLHTSLRSAAEFNQVLGLVLCAAILLAGCPDCDGGGGGGENDGGTEPEPCETTSHSCIALGDWCHTFASEECIRRVRCGLLEEARMAGCISRLAEICPQASIEHSVRSGRATYWSTRAVECVTRYVETLGCGGGFRGFHQYDEDLFNDVLSPEPPGMAVCRTIFEGRSEPGGVCGQAIDCAPGAFCDLTTCPGTCVAYSKPGEPCGAGCGPEAVCYFENNQSLCRPRSELGQGCACPIHRLDPQCGCRLDLVCNAAPLSSSGQCVQARAAIGEPCDTYGPGCIPSGYCKGGTCVPLEKEGASCSQSASSCEAGLWCRNGVCGPRGNEGDACQLNADCKYALFCENSRCRAFPGEGQPCASVFPYCDPAYACNPSGVCGRLGEKAACLP